MNLSKFSDYSLRVLLYLGTNNEGLCTVGEISECYGISRNHLVKVVHNLTSLGIVESFKGSGGGLQLAVDPKEVRAGRLIQGLENEQKGLVECLGEGGDCLLDGSCKLKKALKEAQVVFYNHLDRFTLADLLQNKASLKRLLSN